MPPLSAGRDEGELRNVIHAGVEGHPELEWCGSEAEADFVLVDFRHLAHDDYEIVAAIVKLVQTSAFKRRDMDEDVLRTLLGCDKAKAFFVTEPLNCSFCHW